MFSVKSLAYVKPGPPREGSRSNAQRPGGLELARGDDEDGNGNSNYNSYNNYNSKRK